METILGKIEQVLNEEIQVHNDLIVSSQAFNVAIKDGETQTVDTLRLQNDTSLCTIERLEEKRVACCTEVASLLGITRTPLKLTMVLEKISAAWKERLEHQQQLLKQRIAELAKITTSNRILLEEGLKMIGVTFACLKKSGNRFSAYGHNGKTTPSSIIAIVNRTA